MATSRHGLIPRSPCWAVATRWLALAIVLAPIGAEAQTDAEAQARQQFERGQALYEEGEFLEAAQAFEEAYRISERPRLLYNAYLAYRDLQDTPNAARTLRQFLVEVNDLAPRERSQLRARLDALEAALERGEDGTEAPRETEGSATDTSGGGEGDADTGTTSDTTETPAAAGGGGFNPSPVGFIVAGAGAALGIAAIITGVISGDDYAQLEAQCAGGSCPDTPELRDARSRGEALTVATDVLWVSGVVAIAAGVTLIFVLQDSSESPSVAAACGPDGCFGAVEARF